MKSTKQKREEALFRRQNDIATAGTDYSDPKIREQKIKAAQADVAALKEKLGIIPSEFIVA